MTSEDALEAAGNEMIDRWEEAAALAGSVEEDQDRMKAAAARMILEIAQAHMAGRPLSENWAAVRDAAQRALTCALVCEADHRAARLLKGAAP